MPLSNREVTVLRYLANGMSNKEIAEQLLLSNKTISAHKANIFLNLAFTLSLSLSITPNHTNYCKYAPGELSFGSHNNVH